MDTRAEALHYEEEDMLSVAVAEGEEQEGQDGEEDVPDTKPIIIIKVMQGGMEASLLLHRSGPKTVPPLKEDIMAALAEQNVVYNINQPLLDDLCERPVYYYVFIIARGIPAKVGRDGYVNFLVDSSFVPKPVINEDGIADYKNIGFPKVVYKEQPLAELYPAEKGADGMDIHGRVLEGKYGREARNPQGENTAFNEAQSVLYSLVDGRVTIAGGVVSVTEVLLIKENVDNATGNINFTGDVVVGGDVLTDFSIKCGGSIIVHGSVEGATLEAGADISVTNGMFGMGKGKYSAGGSIKCKFVQNCNIRAAGNIYADSIMFSNVECNGDLELLGKKAALIGGRINIAGKLLAKTVGTSMHVPTEINFFTTGTEKDALIQELEEKVLEMDREIRKIVQLQAYYEELNKKVRLNSQQIAEILQAKENYGKFITDREDARDQIDKIKVEQQENSSENNYIECKGRIHTNTRITFGAAELIVTRSFNKSRVYVTKDGIEIQEL